MSAHHTTSDGRDIARIDHLLSWLENAQLQPRPDRGSYAYDGDVKSGPQRREEYQRLLNRMRDVYLRNGLFSEKMLQILDNLEIELRAEGFREQGKVLVILNKNSRIITESRSKQEAEVWCRDQNISPSLVTFWRRP